MSPHAYVLLYVPAFQWPKVLKVLKAGATLLLAIFPLLYSAIPVKVVSAQQ